MVSRTHISYNTNIGQDNLASWSFFLIAVFIFKSRFDRKQGFFDLTNVLINGKEANFDEDDPLPFTAAHLLQLPDLFWNTISPGQDSKPE